MEANFGITRGSFEEHSDSIVLRSGQSQSVEVYTKGSLEISLQANNSGGNNLEIRVYPSLGLGFTTTPIKNISLIKDENQIVKIDSGYYKIKIEFLNKDLDNSTVIDYICIVKK